MQEKIVSNSREKEGEGRKHRYVHDEAERDIKLCVLSKPQCSHPHNGDKKGTFLAGTERHPVW